MSELPSFFRKTIKEKKLESHKKVCENKGFGNLIVPSEDIKILEFNHYLECIIEKIDGCIILKIHLQQR